MRQIYQIQGRLKFVLNPLGGFGDPARGGVGWTLRGLDACSRSPKRRERELAQILFDRLGDGIGRGVDVKNLPAIGGVHWARCDRVIRGGIHVMPPEQFCDGEIWISLAKLLPEFLAPDKMVRLFPELDFGKFAIIPTVAN